MIICGLVQAASSDSLFENVYRIKTIAKEAEEQNCNVLCFPEAFLTGYSSKNAKELAITRENRVFKIIAGLSMEHDMDILIGYLEKESLSIDNPDTKEKDVQLSVEKSERLYITHDIFTPDGQRYSYRKTHLGDREKEVFTEGSSLDVFPLSCGITAAIQLCVENHYPDITRTYSLKGAHIVFAPHAVPRIAGDREKIWSKFIPARSYDNRVYMACCNQWGGCFVTDPAGEVITSYFDEDEKLLCFSLDKDNVAKYHEGSDKMSARYYPSKRRRDLYL